MIVAELKGTPKKSEPIKLKFKVGDKVIINGPLYANSNATKSTSSATNKITKITRVAIGAKHPYNTTGDLGWMDEDDIKNFQIINNKPVKKSNEEIAKEVIEGK